jgi:hypothetical protein
LPSAAQKQAEKPLREAILRRKAADWYATLPRKRSEREETAMRRRDLLKAGFGAATALAAPRIGGGQDVGRRADR